MADVEMSDAPTAAKKADGTVAKSGDGKKKFEVKKVGCSADLGSERRTRRLTVPVECGVPLGLGYRRRQLRYLPKSHHGPLYAPVPRLPVAATHR